VEDVDSGFLFPASSARTLVVAQTSDPHSSLELQFEHDGCDFYEAGGEWHDPVREVDAFLEAENQRRE
jgi:hypothetical protein